MPRKDERRISIVVPAYNEEQRLSKTLPHLCKDARRRFASFEIIVVDDGSTDGTSQVVRKNGLTDLSVRLIRYEKNMGKGHAVRRGMLAAKNEYVLFCDADLSTPLREVKKLLKELDEGYDIAIGSRARRDSKILRRQPFYRILMGKTFNKIVQILAFPGINDTQCGFKCFKAAIAHDIFRDCHINGFSFDVEMLFIAKKRGFKVKEVGVLWKNNALSKVHPVFHSLQMFKDLLVIRWHALLGYYGRGLGLRNRTEASSSR